MQYSIKTIALNQHSTACLIVGIYADQQLSRSALLLDQLTNGIITKLIKRGDISGENAQTLLLNYIPDSDIERILLLGFGAKKELNPKLYRKALSAAVTTINTAKIESASCTLIDIELENSNVLWKTRQIIETFADANYQYRQTKSIKDPSTKLKTLQIITTDATNLQVEQGLQQGLAIANGIELTKSLADLPGNICTPSFLASKAQALAHSVNNMSVEILEESCMQKLGMGALLSVTRGSRQPAKLIVLNYQGGRQGNQPIVLVGKGLTFDAGGISLKPSADMDEMKYDMCGGACVLGALKAASQMNLKLNIIGIIPSSENLPDGDANKPGDVVVSMSGLTIEVLNTDAEGRLILCDALTYAKKFNPEVIIDLATLTGACVVALGKEASGLFGNDKALCADLIKASKTACDSLWQLPLWEEYQEQLKSNFADLANVGGRDAGAITAACFLANFTKDYRWAHIDIAGTAWRSGTNKGASGRPVSLLSQYLIDRANDGG